MTGQGERSTPVRCAFCGYEVPPSLSPVDTDTHRFCSTACREAFADGREPFAEALGFKRRPIGVPVLGRVLPEGIPSYATVIVIGEEGTQTDALLLEALWRALERGEPALLGPVDKPPTTIVDAFLAHGWNVIPYMDAGQFRIIDMYTRRLRADDVYANRTNEWSSFLLSGLENAIVQARDPSDLHAVANKFDQTCAELEMANQGIAAIDDLTELASYTPELRAINFLKEVRGIVSKARDVPLLVGASESRREGLYPTNYPQDHEYLFDGIIDLELNDSLIEGRRIKRASVRKMDDVTVDPRWQPYDFERGRGFVPVDPHDGTPR